MQCIIDEAGMCNEPESLVPLVSHNPKQVVLIGDHKQLRPIIQEKYSRILGAETSLVERYHREAITLRIQYRMHEELCRFPSDEFYNGTLITDESVKSRPPESTQISNIWPNTESVITPHIFCHHIGIEETLSVKAEEGNEQSKSNPDEVVHVVRIASYLIQRGIPSKDVVVLSQYKSQVVAIKNRFRRRNMQIQVQTVVKSQGSEWDYVILSTVRSLPKFQIEQEPNIKWKRNNLGLIMDDNQMNVALTRAKRGLIIIGNRYLLSTHDKWRHLIQKYENTNSSVEAWNFLRENVEDGPLEASRVIDYNGGYIKIPRTDIKLTIPRGALKEEQRKRITISVVIPESSWSPPFPGIGSVAPIIRCEPCGLKFQKSVSLDIPHCLEINDPKKCKVTVFRKHANDKWKEIRNSKRRLYTLQKTLCTVNLTSFSDDTVGINGDKNNITGKTIDIVAVGEEIHGEDDDIEIDIYFMNAVDGNLESLKKSLIETQKILKRNKFLFYHKEKDLKVTLHQIRPSEWEVSPKDLKVQGFNHDVIWSCKNGFWQDLPFPLERTTVDTMRVKDKFPKCVFKLQQEGEQQDVTLVLLTKKLVPDPHTIRTRYSSASSENSSSEQIVRQLSSLTVQVQEDRTQNVSDKQLRRIAIKYEGDPKDFAIAFLDLSNTEYEKCTENIQGKVDKVFNILLHWRKTNDEKATICKLREALEEDPGIPNIDLGKILGL